MAVVLVTGDFVFFFEETVGVDGLFFFFVFTVVAFLPLPLRVATFDVFDDILGVPPVG